MNGKFDVGLLLDSGWNVGKSIELAALAEKSGYDTVWANGNILSRDPITVLSIISSQTRRVRLGTNVLDAYMRHPMTIASAMATLNDAANGRAVLGLGTGYPEALGKIGIERKIPLTRCREIIQLVRALHAGEAVTFSGSAFTFQNAKLGFESHGRIPIILGIGQGPKMMQFAGEACDGAIMSETTDEIYKERLAQIRKGLSTTNRDARQFEIILDIMVSVGKTRSEAAETLRPWMKKRIEKKSGALQIIDLTEEKAKRYTENPKEIPEDYLQRMAICGTADDCLDRINELRKIGITGVAHRYPTEQTIRGVSEALLPSLFATA